MILGPIWQRQFTFIFPSQQMIFENYFECVSASNIACFSLDQVALFVYDISVKVKVTILP